MEIKPVIPALPEGVDPPSMEVALRVSEKKYRQLVEHAVDGIILGDSDGFLTDANSKACEMTGYPREELLGHHISKLYSESVLRERPLRFDLLSEGRTVIIERDLLRADGTLLPVEMNSKRMPDGTHQAFLRDITERRRAEAALARERTIRDSIVELNPYAIQIADTKGHIIHNNLAVTSMFGSIPPADYSFFRDPALERSGVTTLLNEVMQGKSVRIPPIWYSPHEAVPGHSSRKLCLRSSMFPILGEDGRVENIVIMHEDITMAAGAEEALRRSEEQLRTLIDAMPDIVCFKDGQGRWLEANNFTIELFQLQGLSYRGKSEAELAQLRPFYQEALQECSFSDELAWRLGHSVRCEEVIPRPDGPSRLFDTIKVPLFKSDGSRRGLVALGRDVTERKLSEAALRESEDRFRALCDNTIDSLFWISVEEDGSFRLEGINPAQEKLLGMKSEEVVGKRLEDFLKLEQFLPIQANYSRCLEAGQPIHYEESVDLREERLTFQTLLVPIRDDQGKIYRIIGSSRDITQGQRAEEALRQAQKLESLGILAGGIAHDFNNLLTAMLGNLNLAQMRSSPESPALPYLENAEKIILRAADLTKQMLAYSGKGRFVVLPHDLNKVVQEMTHLINVSIPKKISLRCELSPNLPLFEADAAQIQQVVLNLVTNASEAIGEAEGVIRIATRKEYLDEVMIAAAFTGQSLGPGLCVVLEVSDTGCGMKQEVIARIFDPFFTTKRSGRGLGLSAMLGILRGHRAGIRIASVPERGSTFTLYFPAKADFALVEAASPQTARVLGCKGRVLLVDDEEAVRESTAWMLESFGLDVLQAVDGLDAIAIFQSQKGTIDLVLMDLTMPRLDGREAFAQLRELQADIPVILFSGFSEGESLHESLGVGLAGFIQKPFDLRDLKRAVHAVLGVRE